MERSPRVSSELARGRQALAAGDLQSAQSAFTAALRGSPNDPEPAIGLAETYVALGDLETAGRLFDVVAKTEGGAGDPRLLQGRGLVALGQGRTDEAVGLLEQSVDRDASLWRAWAALGRAYGRQGNARRARTAFGRAEEAAPSPAVVINDLGMLHLEDNDPAAALEAFQRALAVDPGNSTASANARIARAMLGDYDAAISGARPDELPDVLNNVGYIAVVNGDFDVADRLLRRAIEISPVYHEAASANLNLLAQAMKGVPVLALAGPGAAASRVTADTALSSIAQSGTVALDPSGAPGGIEVGDRGDGAPAGAAAPVPADPVPTEVAPPGTELASIRPEAPAVNADAGVMAHGFRWDSQPVSAAKPAKSRKRRAARPDPSPDAGDPRSAAWPAISVQPAGPAVATSEPVAEDPAPEPDNRMEPREPQAAAPIASGASKAGLPE